MTVGQLRTELGHWPDDLDVLVEVKYKTGYDEGDIWDCDVRSVGQGRPNGPVRVELGGATRVGGW